MSTSLISVGDISLPDFFASFINHANNDDPAPRPEDSDRVSNVVWFLAIILDDHIGPTGTVPDGRN
jgi:hypothetical protein